MACLKYKLIIYYKKEGHWEKYHKMQTVLMTKRRTLVVFKTSSFDREGMCSGQALKKKQKKNKSLTSALFGNRVCAYSNNSQQQYFLRFTSASRPSTVFCVFFFMRVQVFEGITTISLHVFVARCQHRASTSCAPWRGFFLRTAALAVVAAQTRAPRSTLGIRSPFHPKKEIVLFLLNIQLPASF